MEAQTIISGGGSNFLVIGLSTLLFAGVHVQFWYEESEQGRRFHRALDRMRGRIYEDDATGLPNSRHFVFELRRQMMRSVRNGRGFSLVLTDFGGFEKSEGERRAVPAVGFTGDAPHSRRRRLRRPPAGARCSRRSSPTTRDQTAADKADNLLPALGSCIPLEYANQVFPVVSLSGTKANLKSATSCAAPSATW